MQSGCAFGVRLWIGLAVTDVAGGDEMLHMIPETGRAQADFRERARGGSDDNELRGGDGSDQLLSSGECDDIGDVLDFRAFHPIVLGEMRGGVGVGEKFLNRGEAGAAVSELHGVIGVELVLESPARPNASDSGGGVDEDAVHVDQEGLAQDFSHGLPG